MKEKSKYYSCNYLLTLKDMNGKKPDIYIADGNRTAGKSVSFKKVLTDTYLRKGRIAQFYYLFRYKTDMQNISDMFFGDIQRLFYQDHEMTEKKLFDGAIVQLLIDNNPAGFCIPLSLSAKIKRMSAIFKDVEHGFFDEYQDENNQYLPDELDKLHSIHTTIARGDGKQSRRVPLYMASNTVSMLNPYYSLFGISKMLRSNTKILRGDGWVFERTYNENAQKEFQESAFNRAFAKTKYYGFASQNVYLNDNMALISKPSGHSDYMCSVRYNGEWYNIRKYDTCVYASEGYDETFPRRIAFQVNDVVDDRATMITSTNFMVQMLRIYFNKGAFRFENLRCKNMALDLLAYI